MARSNILSKLPLKKKKKKRNDICFFFPCLLLLLTSIPSLSLPLSLSLSTSSTICFCLPLPISLPLPLPILHCYHQFSFLFTFLPKIISPHGRHDLTQYSVSVGSDIERVSQMIKKIYSMSRTYVQGWSENRLILKDSAIG